MSEEEKKQAAEKKISEHSVIRYLSILFAAAFVLLLITFAMERRQHEVFQEQSQEQINNLQQSITATQSLKNLYDENAKLKEEVNELTNHLKDMENKLSDTQEYNTKLQDELSAESKSVAAMDWFWQINEAYVRNRTDLCLELIQAMEELDLVDYLPHESATNTDRFSPYDRFIEIRTKLIPSDENT